MNLFTFNFKIFQVNAIRSLIVAFSMLSIYHSLIVTKVIKGSNGINVWQDNFIRLQRYAYQDYSQLNIVIVGSSLTANLPTTDLDYSVINLGMSGSCTQTGMEAVLRKSSKPALLIVEINETINRKIDDRTIDSIYNPFFYTMRLYFPMLKEEYKPVSIVEPMVIHLMKDIIKASGFTKKQKVTNSTVKGVNKLTDTLISQAIEKAKNPLSEMEKSLLRQEAESIKIQLAKIKGEGVRVVLYDVPRDPRLQATVKEKQLEALMKELFPANDFEWLPKPPPRYWKTYDGLHLVSSDAKDYVAFLKNQLLTSKATLSKSRRLQSTLKPY